MRPADYWLSACFIFQLMNLASTTADSNQASGPAFKLVTVPPRPETNDSSAPTFLKPRNSADEVIDDKLWSDEERGWEKLLLYPTDEAALGRLIKWIKERTHPAEVLEPLDVRAEREQGIQEQLQLQQGMQHADTNHDQVSKLDDTAMVTHLRESVGAERLVNVLVLLEKIAGMEDLARSLHRVLFSLLSKEKIFPLWCTSGITPEKAYHMMPIAREKMLTSNVKEAATWPDIRDETIQWLEYAVYFYRNEEYYSGVEVLNVLKSFRGIKELLALSASLPDNRHIKYFAKIWQKELYRVQPEIRPEIIDIWLNLGKTPEEVYNLMPISSEKVLQGDVQEKANWVTVRDKMMEWFGYYDKFMDRSIYFTDKDETEKLLKAITPVPGDERRNMQEMIEAEARLRRDIPLNWMLADSHTRGTTAEDVAALLRDADLAKRMKDRVIALRMLFERRSDEMAVFFHWLRDCDGMKPRADAMQQWLLGHNSMKKKEQHVFKLWLASGLNPEEVYHMMPFASEEPFDPTVGRSKGDWGRFGKNFMQLLRYVDLYNGGKSNFGPYEVARLLKKHRHKRELEFCRGTFPDKVARGGLHAIYGYLIRTLENIASG